MDPIEADEVSDVLIPRRWFYKAVQKAYDAGEIQLVPKGDPISEPYDLDLGDSKAERIARLYGKAEKKK